MLAIHQILTEIVEKIEIAPDLTISHPEYPPLELHPALITKLPQLSPQFQLKCTIDRVQTYLHDIYFTHRLMSLAEIAIAAQQPQQIKNNLIDGIDINFFQRLRQSNTSTGYFDRDWQVVASDGNELIVVKDGLSVHIQPHQHLPPLRQAEIGDVVPIYLAHNLVDRDTYIIVGNAGIPDRARSIQIYFHVTPDAAVAIAYQLTSGLNTLNIPFQLAILHDPSLFYRYDSSTLWLNWADYLQVQPVLGRIYRSHQTAFSPQVPLFSKQLAPGLGLVEVPTSSDPFGIHRCRLLATGLVTAMAREQPQSTLKLETIRQGFGAAGIDWQQTHLSFSTINSDDLYILERS